MNKRLKLVDADELTPPLSQMTISLSSRCSLLAVGKNQKKSSSLSPGLVLTGRLPAYDSPTSKLTSGRVVPLT